MEKDIREYCELDFEFNIKRALQCLSKALVDLGELKKCKGYRKSRYKENLNRVTNCLYFLTPLIDTDNELLRKELEHYRTKLQKNLEMIVGTKDEQ